MLRHSVQRPHFGKGAAISLCLFLLGLITSAPAMAQELKREFTLPDLSADRFIAAPVVVTADMNKAEGPVSVTYTLRSAATVQVHVFGLDKAKLASAEPRRAKVGETVVERLKPWRQLTDNKEGTYLLVYAIIEKDSNRKSFADVGVLESGEKEGSRFDKFEVVPDAGMLFKITYKLKVTSKVFCQSTDSEDPQDPPKPVWESDDGERKDGQEHHTQWDATKSKTTRKGGSYLVQVTAGPLKGGKGSGESRWALVDIK